MIKISTDLGAAAPNRVGFGEKPFEAARPLSLWIKILCSNNCNYFHQFRCFVPLLFRHWMVHALGCKMKVISSLNLGILKSDSKDQIYSFNIN